jgi:hypothetical protein
MAHHVKHIKGRDYVYDVKTVWDKVPQTNQISWCLYEFGNKGI